MSFPLCKTQCVCTIDGVSIDVVDRLPQKSNMLRVTGNSTLSMGGTFLIGEDLREFGFDAELERQHALQYCQDPAVAHVESQAVITPFIDRHGKSRETVWDLRVTYKDGTIGLKSVKTLVYAMTEEFAANFALICAGIPPGVADSVQVLTEHSLDPVQVDRGTIFNKALTAGQPAAAEIAYEFLTQKAEPVPIQDVCDHLRQHFPAPEDGHFRALSVEFWAVVWLMAKRAAKLCSEGYITTTSLVGVA